MYYKQFISVLCVCVCFAVFLSLLYIINIIIIIIVNLLYINAMCCNTLITKM